MAETATLTNTSDRAVVVNARDPQDVGVRRDFTIDADGGSLTLLRADAVAIATTRDYLNVGDVAAGEVVDPAIVGVAMGAEVGHTTAAASDAGPIVDETTTVVPDGHAPGVDDAAASLAGRGGEGTVVPTDDDGGDPAPRRRR